MNEGWPYAHEYESFNNIQRRLFIANPLYCNTNSSSVRQLINRHIYDYSEEYLCNFKRNEYRYLPKLKDYEYIPNALVPRRFSLESKITKQCPECAKIVFHSDIYNFQWVTHCPYHNVELTTHCPACHQDWPDYSPYSYKDDLNNHCPCCGIIKTVNSDLTIDYKLALSETIKPTFEVVDLYLSNTIEYVTDHLEEDHRNMVALETRNLPSILSHLAPCAISEDYCNGLSVDKVEFEPEKTDPKGPDWQAPKIRYPLCMDKILKTKLEDATRELASQIKNNADPAHKLRDMSLIWDFLHCPYCLAFGLWYHHWHYGQPIDLYGYLELSDPTVFSHLVTTDHIKIKLPINIQSIFFYNELRYSFSVIFRYVCAFLTSLQTSTNRSRYWLWPSETLNKLPQPRYSDFLFYKNKKKTVTFLYVTENQDFLELPTGLHPYCDPIFGDRSLYKDTTNGYYLNSIKKEFFYSKNIRR